MTFTKFPSSLTGPVTPRWSCRPATSTGRSSWSSSIGRGGHGIDRADAWAHVAGLTIGQDLSERVAQLDGTPPQFGLAKSHPGFRPTGPWLVTPDELADRDDLAISCAIDGETMQQLTHVADDLRRSPN